MSEEYQDEAVIGFPTPLDTSNVISPIEVIQAELAQFDGMLSEIEGNIATLSVQHGRMKIVRDALREGLKELETSAEQ
jgi:hypothetical protein